MRELIARLEAAAEGSEALDAAIVAAIDWRPEWCSKDGGELWVDDSDPHLIAVRLNTTGQRSRGQPPIGAFPAFTTSLDAALTLRPADWRWQVSDRAVPPHKGRAFLNNGASMIIGMAGARNPAFRYQECTAGTAALAICIAALRARSTVLAQSGETR